MSPDQIARVRATWMFALRAPESAAAVLDAHLRVAAPGVITLLADAGVVDAGAELLAWVDYAVHELDALPGLVAATEVFGRAEADRGIDSRHFQGARTAFFRTLADLLGAAFDADARAAWTAGYDVLAGALQHAMCAAPDGRTLGAARGSTAGPVALVATVPPPALLGDVWARGAAAGDPPHLPRAA
jgi:hypothetical protein